jgi:caa(3)-type oxidase subunit IV
MASSNHGPSPYLIWVFLMALLGAGMLVFLVEMSHTMVISLLLAVAVVKATLVVRYYMHMQGQPTPLYAVAGLPVLLLIFMVVALLPDISYHPYMHPKVESAAPAHH